jgi:thiol-disulfide isomerase/thioredoxin
MSRDKKNVKSIVFLSALLLMAGLVTEAKQLSLPLQRTGTTQIAIVGKNTILSGSIKNHSISMVSLQSKRLPSIIAVPVDSHGKFTIELVIEEPLDGFLAFDEAYGTYIYIEPGDKLDFLADEKFFNQSFTFKGDRAKANNFCKEIIKHNFVATYEEKYRALTEGDSPSEYFLHIDSISKAHLDLLRTTFSISLPSCTPGVSENIPDFIHRGTDGVFVTKAFYDILFKNLNDRLLFAGEKKNVGLDYYKGTYRNPSHVNFVFKILDKAVHSEEFLSYVRSYLFYRSNFSEGIYWENTAIHPDYLKYKKEIGRPYCEAYYDIIKLIMVGKTLEYALADYVVNAFINNTFEEVLPAYEKFLKDGKDSSLLHRVKRIYIQAKTFAKGAPAPSFSLNDLDGNIVSLSDFKGKVIYMDFWASWCAPCLGQMEYTRKLKDTFRDENDLVFLYISIDNDNAKWKRAIKQYNIEGVHVNAPLGFSDSVARDYNVNGGVPKYILIDKKGNFFDSNAPRPYLDETERKIREALNQK